MNRPTPLSISITVEDCVAHIRYLNEIQAKLSRVRVRVRVLGAMQMVSNVSAHNA